MSDPDIPPLQAGGQFLPAPVDPPHTPPPMPEKLPDPEPVPPPPPSPTALLDELNELTDKLVERDTSIRGLRNKITELYSRISECHARMRIRRRYVTEKAADIICKRHGVHAIDGYQDRRWTARARRQAQKRKLQLLKEAAGALLPPELEAEISPASEDQQPPAPITQ